MQNLRIHSMSNLEASELQQLEATLVATVVNNNNKKNNKKTEATICLGNEAVEKCSLI